MRRIAVVLVLLPLVVTSFAPTRDEGRRAFAAEEPKRPLPEWGPIFEELEIQKIQQDLSARERPRAVAFTDVTVLPMGKPGDLRDQTVVVRDGRIESIGPALSTPVPADALRVEGRGRVLMPGLVDMHVHTLKRSAHMLLELANGVTSVREMDGFPWLLAQREQVRRNRLLAPNMYVAGHVLNYFPMGIYATAVTSTKQARAVVREQKAAGYDFIKVHNVAPHPLYDAILDEARRQDIRVVGHIPHDVLVSEAVAAGQRTFEHLKGYYLDTTLEISKEDWLAATPRTGVWNCPTLYVRRGGYTADEIRALGSLEETRYVSRRDRRAWLAAGEDENAKSQRRIWELSREIFRRLLAGGALFLAGTDSGVYANTVPGFALREELLLMESLGMPTFDVLNAATANAAEAMERTAEFGTVEVGKRADLLLLDADPRAGVERIGRPRGVMARGIWLDRSALDAMLRRIEKTYARLGGDASLDAPSEGQISRLVADMAAMAAEGWIFRDHQLDELALLLRSRGRDADAVRVAVFKSVPPPAAPASVVIADVSVVPMDTERVLAHQTVVVTDGVVARIGPADSVQMPEGAVRVDGRGKYLMPGLVDFHVHLQSPDELLTYLSHGVTSVVNLNGAPHFLEWRALAARADFAGARLFTSGPTLDGFPPTTAKFVALATPEGGRDAVAAQKKAGYDLVKVYARLPLDVLEAMTAEGRARHIAVVGHVSRLVGSVKAMRSGEAMIAHGEEFLMDLFDATTHTLDESRIPGLAAVAKETGAAVTPNLSAIQFMLDQVDDLPAVLALPDMRDVPPAAYHELKASNNRYTNRGNLDEFRGRLRMQLAVEKKLVKAFSDVGVPLLLGTDASTVGLAGYSDREEIRLLLESGLSPFEVLRAATRTAGELLGKWTSVPAPMGTVVEGAAADLLLVSKNPFEDPTIAVRPDGVIRAGRWFSRAELARRQAELSLPYPKMKVFVDAFDELAHAGRVAEAVALYEKERAGFAGAVPLKFDVLYSQGRELTGKDPRAALPFLELAARLYPDEVSLHDNLGEARSLAGDAEGARRAFDAALALCPQDETARKGRAATGLDRGKLEP